MQNWGKGDYYMEALMTFAARDIYSIYDCTDKKENQIFLIYKEIQNGAVARSYMTNGTSYMGNICVFPHI